MRFFDDPKIVVVGRQVIDIEGVQEFLDDHGMEWHEWSDKLANHMDLGDKDAEWLMELGGRTCYMSWPEVGQPAKGRSHDEHVQHIIEVQHGSVLEHLVLSIQTWGVSRSFLAELTRHRAGVSPSVLSQRYVGGEHVSFVVPPDVQALKNINPTLYKEWIVFCEASKDFYDKMADGLSELHKDVKNKTERRKKARQAARSVLPNATETKMLLTMNGRAIRHVCEMRGHPAADLEIRKWAVELFKAVNKDYKLVTHGMRLVTLEDGTQGVESDYRKV